jgi:predicted nucleic acid-binding protein
MQAPLTMLSMDTNLLLYAFNQASPWHKQAYGWMSSIQHEEDVAVSEFILAKFYGLLRNPAVLKRKPSKSSRPTAITRVGVCSASRPRVVRCTMLSGKGRPPGLSASVAFMILAAP